ncbi:MAG TPA: anti-sigma factor [Agromyces sp.]|nr:anti-sigma factor [Agromyces sp.]
MTEPGFPGRPVDPDELLAAYALDAVTDEEREIVERRLAESAEARAEVEAYREAAGRLAETTTPVAPPPSLKASVFDRLDDAPQVGRPDGAAQDAPVADTPSAPDEPAGDARFTSIESLFPPAAEPLAPDASAADAVAPEGAPAGPAERAARRRWFQRPVAIAASAAAAVLLIAGAIVGLNWGGPAGWGAQRDVQAIAAAPDAQTATVTAEGGGDITLVWSEQLGRSAVQAAGLPDVGDDRTYELWYIDADGATPAGTFEPARGAAYVVLDGEFEPGLLVGITVEPSGGSEEPTTVPIAAFET